MRYWAPWYWLHWLFAALAIACARLPWPAQRWLGDRLGDLLWRLAAERRQDCRINIRHCFPELTDTEQLALARRVFRESGRGLLDIAWAWSSSARTLQQTVVQWHGREWLDAARQSGRGVLLLGGHFSSLERSAALLATALPTSAVYRPQKSGWLTALMVRGRRHYFQQLIERRDTRALYKTLRDGGMVWYAPDQDYGRKHAVFVPFFGVTAATVATPARLAAQTQATALMIGFRRDDHGCCHFHILPLPADFTTLPAEQSARCVNAALEQLIRAAPAQYMWYHRRFKTRPDGEPALYPVKRKHRQRLKKP